MLGGLELEHSTTRAGKHPEVHCPLKGQKCMGKVSQEQGCRPESPSELCYLLEGLHVAEGKNNRAEKRRVPVGKFFLAWNEGINLPSHLPCIEAEDGLP